MQTLSTLRALLQQAGLRPQRQFGQNFLIDRNLMDRLIELAEPLAGRSVLEIGPATGSLSEELLDRGARVTAVEIDRGLAGVLAGRFAGREGLEIRRGDILAGKHELSAEMTAGLPDGALLVSNLPYNVAAPVVAECLAASWRVAAGRRRQGDVRFQRLCFTVQEELARRMDAAPASEAYGPLSVLVSLLGRVTWGPMVPAGAFWPRPKVCSRILRIDFEGASAERIADLDALQGLLRTLFNHRRKKISARSRFKHGPYDADRFLAAAAAAQIDPDARAEELSPGQFLAMAENLGRG
jgi:16S rRNA (adenine1518-N6/adenine1519-N6)-dimethyltransferase